ncbi:MAG TPA: hypothetical protein VNN79_25200 [Actinomycetota bacterium]|nr:hypothetical protein [Actinomycetota bacterium]
MGYVHKAPATGRTYDSDRRQTRADIARLNRKRFEPPPVRPFVHVEPEPSEHWRPGEAWLDTSGEG